MPGMLDSLAAAVDVLVDGAREACDHGFLGAFGEGRHRLKVPFGGDGEPRLDDVYPHLVEKLGDFQLLVMGHGGAGRLLAVSQGGVEYDDVIGTHRSYPVIAP